jgi:hypothetical protein
MQLHAAQLLRDLSIFPGNHLEALKRDRKGQHSIRINDQYRICFVWRDGDAFEVEIVDYHQGLVMPKEEQAYASGPSWRDSQRRPHEALGSYHNWIGAGPENSGK